jgi:hypothetical protein
MQFRWIALLVLWTSLSGPILCQPGLRLPFQPQTSARYDEQPLTPPQPTVLLRGR